MRKHTGMRPHDIPILLKLITLKDQAWRMKDISSAMFISASEVSESLNRSHYATLIDDQKKIVLRQNLYEFLMYGVRYVFPQKPGPLMRGIPTAHSHPSMEMKFISEVKYVWPYPNGKTMGSAIEPFYQNQLQASLQDDELYKLLSLVDVIRVGRTREVKYAHQELRKIFHIESPREYHKD
ncbi:MAG: hypothetical protein WBP41_07590 [Saprospiraceae bacterium]